MTEGKNMNTRRKTGLAALALGVLAAAWLAFSPYMALAGIRDAIQARDADRINSYIDYDALRTSLKEQIATSMALEMSRQGKGGGGRLDPQAAQQALAFAGPMIDKMVQPQTVIAMLSGKPGGMSGGPGQASRLKLTGEDVQYNRTSLTTFSIEPKGMGGGLQFALRGLGWKLVGIAPAG